MTRFTGKTGHLVIRGTMFKAEKQPLFNKKILYSNQSQCSFALPWLIRDDKDLIWNNAKYTGWLEIPHSSLAPPLGHRKDSQSVHKPNYAMKEKGVAQTRLSLMNFCRCQMFMRMNCWKDYWRGFASNIPLNY